MNPRMIFALLILYVIFAIYSIHSYGNEVVDVKVTPRSARQGKTKEIEVISAVDNKNGTGTFFISACGALLEITASNRMIKYNQDTLKQIVIEAAKRSCGSDF